MLSKSGGNSNKQQIALSSRKRDAMDPFSWFFDFPLVQGARWDLESTGESFIPRVDIHEDKNAIHVDVELAGIPKDKIKIEYADEMLTISGENEVRTDEQDKDKKWHRVERRYGSFKRQIALPPGIDNNAITASHKDGLLSVMVPKPRQPEKKVNKIQIQ